MPDLTTILGELDERLSDGTASAPQQAIQSSLNALRALVKMDVAFVSTIAEGRRYFDFLDASPDFTAIRVGDSDALESTYCARVIDGRIPAVVPDTRTEPEVCDLPVTSELPVGAHLSVPIRRSGGEIMGTLCCFSMQPDPDLRTRDLDLLNVFAGLISGHMDRLLRHDRRIRSIEALVDAVVRAGGPQVALQPIVDLATRMPVMFEALARFPAVDSGTHWGPDVWFREAAMAGRGHELEASALRAALARARMVPIPARLTVNVSAGALCSSQDVQQLVTSHHAARLVVEVTEHEAVEDYDELETVLAAVRREGGQVAVDDAGSGYAGLQHILRLRPELLKLDRELVHGIAADPSRQAMCTAMVDFTHRTGSSLVAEGVEEVDDLEMLRALGVPLVQGYLLARPELVTPQVPAPGRRTA